MEIDLDKFDISEKSYLTINQINIYSTSEKKRAEKNTYSLAIFNGKFDEIYFKRHTLVSNNCKGIIQLKGYQDLPSKDRYNFRIERYGLLYEEIINDLVNLRNQSQKYVLQFLHQLINILADLQEAQIAFSYLTPYDIVLNKKEEFKIFNINNVFNLIGDEQDTMNRVLDKQGFPYMDSYMYQEALNQSIVVIPQNYYKSSIYSIAIIALEFYWREFPTKQLPSYDINNLLNKFTQEFGPEYGQFMQKLLEGDRKNRYDCIQARNNLPNMFQTIMKPIYQNPIQQENQVTRRIQKDNRCIPLFEEEIPKKIMDLIQQSRKSKIAIREQDEEQPPSITLSKKNLLNIISNLDFIPFVEVDQITNKICIDERENIFHCQIQGQYETVIVIDNISNIFILQMLLNYEKLQQLNIPGICILKGYSIDQQIEKNSLWCSNLYLIIQKVKGTLAGLKNSGIEIYSIVYQIIKTLSQLNQHYIYGELTSSRIFLTDNNETLIAMYSYTNFNKPITSIRPPEKMKLDQYSSKSDVWSLGLIIYEIISKETITSEQIQKWITQNNKISLNFEKIKSLKLKSILQQMTEYDNNKRISLDNLINEIDILKIYSDYKGQGFTNFRIRQIPKSRSQTQKQTY